MNKTFLAHLDVSSSNINNLAYKIYSTIKNMVENLEMLDKNAIVYMLKTFKQGMEIALSDFEFALNETATDDPLYPYIDYLAQLMQYAFNALDELTYIVEKEFDGRDNTFKVLIKETLSFLQDVTYCVHNWIKELRNKTEGENNTQEKDTSDESDSEED